MANPEPIPGDPIVSVGKSFADSRWTVTNSWFDWLLTLATIVFQSARLLKTVALDTQAASIGATPLIAGKTGSRFLVAVFARIEQAGAVSSDLIVTISSIDGTQAYALSTTPIVNGVAGAAVSQVFLIEGAAAALDYAVTYADGGGTPMQYRVRITVWSAN